MIVTSFAKSEAVATSAYKERRSRHHSMVATSVALKGGRDIIKRSRHQLRRREVATSLSSPDNRTKEKRSRHHSEVATSAAKERRSRHHSAVATSLVKNQGRDISQLSRHPLQVKKVATTVSGRDISYKGSKVATTVSGRDIICKEKRSRHHSIVVTSIVKNQGRDIIQWSRHQ